MRPRALMTPRNLGEHHSPTSISHAIPPPLFQYLNPHRWNSAVFSPLSICLTTELHAKLSANAHISPRTLVPAPGHARRRSRSPRSHPHLNRCCHAPCGPGSHTQAFHEPAQTDIKISKILRSVGEHSRHNRQIVTACARLRRWCARNHFALQLLGFWCDLNYCPNG